MACRGSALLSCALVFLSAAGPACSCPSISEFSCNGGTGANPRGPQSCGGNYIFRCNNSSMEIRFGGTGEWFRVLGERFLFSYEQLEVEDPALSPIFRRTAGCDFLYSFPPLRGPLFAPPERTPVTYPLRDLQSYCNASDYGILFSKLIERYKRGPCTGTYDVSFTPRDLQGLPDPALRKACLPGPGDPDPMFVWTLWMNNTDTNSTFNIVSAGFSRRRRPFRYCFDCEMRGGQCESGSAGTYTCGKKHRFLRRHLIIMATGASILTILAVLLYLWFRIKKTKKPSSSTLLSQTADSLETTSDKDPEEVVSMNYPTHVFRYQELHEATNGFGRANELDQGGHGAVYKGTLPDGRTVAIKRLYENSFKRAELFMNEISILSGLRHPNLVALYGCTSRHSRELLLVYEFIPNGTIADHLHGHRADEGALSWPLRLRIAVEAATALAYLHANKPQIIHRDVKTSNILLDGDFHVKVGDFGLSRMFPMAASHVSTVPQGTPGYMDPQYHRCYQLTDKSDVYSFGVLLAELISSKPAVDLSRHPHEINLADMALTKIQSSALQELVDPKLGFETDGEVRRSIHLVAELAMMCLQGERDMRPTMEAVLEVLQGIADGLNKAEKRREGDHMVGDGIRLQKNREPPSPDTVMGQWSSRSSTPNTSG